MLSSALIKSSLLHFLIVGLLFLSVDIAPIPEPVQQMSIPVIEAVVIDQDALEKQLEDRKQKALAEEREKQRVIKEAQEKKRKEQERLANIEKQKKLEQERKVLEKQEAERKKAEKIAADKKRKELEKKQAEEAAQKAKEQARKEQEATKKAAEEARVKQEQARQQKEIEEQLLAEQQARARQRTEQVLSEVQKYTALITQAIQQKWIVDDSMLGKSCRLNIRLATNGLVIQVNKLSGDDKVCHSAETAIYKAYTLPVSSDPEVFKEFRDFNLTIGHKI